MEDSAIFAFNRDVNLPQGVHAGAIRRNLIALQRELHPRQMSDAVENGIHRTVANARLRTRTAADAQANRRRRNGAV